MKKAIIVQVTKEAPRNIAKELLSKSLQELNGIKGRGDTKEVAKSLSVSVRTIEGYLRGDIADVETGKSIFTALRKIITKRENEVKRLIA